MMEYKERYQEWLSNPYFDAETKAELEGIKEDDNEIKERFYMDLEFGTAGLRGIIGAGTNRMNIYTVRKATQGLANYIIKNKSADKGVAIAYDSRRMSPEFADEARSALRRTGSRLTCSSPCAPPRSFLLRSVSFPVSRGSILRQATIRRSTTDIRYTGRTARRSLRLTTRGSWMR